MAGSVFREIEEKFPSFSKGKQQIASYILENPNEAPFQTAAQIGKAVRISESTVVRFASDLGYKGFPDFQKSLQKEMKSLLKKESSSMQTTDSTGFTGNFHGKEISVPENAVELLARSQRLYVLGTSMGSLLIPYCIYAGEQALDMVIPLSIDSKERLFTGISSIAPGDTVLALALGKASHTFRFALSQCRQLGAQILQLTDSSKDEDSLTIPVSEVGNRNIPDLSGSLAILHRLFTRVNAERIHRSEERKKIIKEIWDNYDKFQK